MPIATKSLPSHLHSAPGIEQSLLHGIDSLAAIFGRPPNHANPAPTHLLTGLHGEEEALFYLRRRGYTVVARRWQTPRLAGDVDLIAWDGPSLCFVEVKTRTGRDLVPAEFAVDQHKQRVLRSLARVFCKRFAEHSRAQIPVRFDVIAVYLPVEAAGRSAPEIEHFTSAFPY
jgi:putative endonuclease